jgi:hypothetical protein
MHRSGTSLITNWLFHCGLQVGENLVGASAANKEGHYEDVEFLRMHEEILAANDYPPSGLIHHRAVSLSEYQLEKLRVIIQLKERHFAQWGWKEPRTCLFLDVYHELIPRANYLVIVRDHAAVVNSLLKRDFDLIDAQYRHRGLFTRMRWNLLRRDRKRKRLYQKTADDYLQVWIDYNERILDLLDSIDGADYLVLNYALLETRDREVFSFLTQVWGFELLYYPFEKVYKKGLMSAKNEIDPFIRDKGLITIAREIEERYKTYMRIA